jgi:hypothetical protein
MTNVSISNTTQASPGLFVQTPGTPIASIPGAQPLQVGMFPPNANALGATSTLAECSRATLPINALITNEGTPAVPLSASLCGSGGPPGDGGNQAYPAGGVPFGSGFNGGTAGIGGAGGANTNGGNAVVGDVSLGAQAAPANLNFAGGTANTQYGG